MQNARSPDEPDRPLNGQSFSTNCRKVAYDESACHDALGRFSTPDLPTDAWIAEALDYARLFDKTATS